ncbi:hypothetical protein LguiB_025001 [Lonicera macranthoides]
MEVCEKTDLVGNRGDEVREKTYSPVTEEMKFVKKKILPTSEEMKFVKKQISPATEEMEQLQNSFVKCPDAELQKNSALY